MGGSSMDRIFAIGLIAVAGGLLLVARSFPTSMFSPVSAGMFPTIMTVALLVCAVLMLAGTFLRRPVDAPEPAESEQAGNELKSGFVLVAVLLVIAIGFERFGFLASCGLAAIALAYFLSRRIVTSILTGGVVVGVVYVIFRQLLNVPLP